MAAATARPEPRGAWGRIDPLLTVALVAIVVLLAVLVAPYISVAPGPPSIRLAVADLRGHALVVMDTGDPGAARRIALPGGPHEFAALPDGRIAVSLEQFGTIALVDPRSGDVQSLRVGGTPHGLAVTADSLYVTDRSVNAVRRFSLATWVEGPSIASGAWPHTVEARPDGSLAIANAADDTLTLGDRAVAVSHVPESIAIASDGRVATAGAVGGALEVFDPTGTLVERHEVGGRPVRLLYDPRGTVLAASLSADGAIALVARDEVRRVAVGGVPAASPSRRTAGGSTSATCTAARSAWSTSRPRWSCGSFPRHPAPARCSYSPRRGGSAPPSRRSWCLVRQWRDPTTFIAWTEWWSSCADRGHLHERRRLPAARLRRAPDRAVRVLRVAVLRRPR